MDGSAIKAAVLLSGSGRTLENLLARIEAGRLNLAIAAVVASRPGVRGLEIAGRHGIPSAVFRRKDYPSSEEHNAALNGWLADRVGHLVLGKDPRMLSDGKRAWWRVAAYVTNVYREPFGPIGFVDVDATSGEVLSGDEMAQELRQRGAHLERHPLAAGN